MKARFVSLALLVALVGAFVAPLTVAAQGEPNNGPYQVRGPVTNEAGETVGRFSGTVSDLAFSGRGDQLLVSGLLRGTATIDGETRNVRQAFEGVLGALRVPRTCEILNLDLGPINLDLLGLVVDISPININITAVRGPGNLLGNLLCALVNLLNR